MTERFEAGARGTWVDIVRLSAKGHDERSIEDYWSG